MTCGGTTKEGIKASGGRGWSGSDGGCIGCGIGWCGCVGTVVPSDGGPGGIRTGKRKLWLRRRSGGSEPGSGPGVLLSGCGS